MDNEIELLVDLLTNQVVDAVQAMPEARVPFASVKLTPDEQMQRYLEIRESPERIPQLFQERGWKDAIGYLRMMERRYRERADEEA